MERVVTVSGDAVAQPSNFKVLFGTNQQELVDAAGGFTSEPEDVYKRQIISSSETLWKNCSRPS